MNPPPTTNPRAATPAKLNMQSFINSLSAVALILVMIGVGCVFAYKGWMKKEHKSFIIKLLINIAVPCMCISNVFAQFTKELMLQAGRLLLVATICNIITLGIGILVAKAVKISHRRFGGFVVMCALSNSVFVGYPVCLELFGDVGTPFVMCYYIMNTAFFWAVGAPLIYASAGETKPTVVSTLKKLASPPLIALAAAVALLLLGVKLPPVALTLCKYMSNTVTPLALMYIGFLIYETGFKNLKPDKGIWVAMAMRFVAAPLIMLGICRIFGIEGIARNVFMIEAAMPVMTQSVVISAAAGADEKYNALGMSFSSLLCLVAVPLLMLIFAQ